MRASTLIAVSILGLAGTLFTPEALQAQFSGFSRKGGPSSMDPDALFDYFAKGRTFFLITDTKSLRDPLTQYAQQKGISNGQITRQQFKDFQADMKAKVASGAMPPPGPGGPPGKMMGLPPGVPQTPDMINQLSDSDFKRRDTNGDGKLNDEEMPGSLKRDLAKWDTNKDGLIDQTEYRAYFASRLGGGGEDGQAKIDPVTIIIIEEEDWDHRATVLRAGKLPKKGLPDWFLKLDEDGDGQIALFEWRKAGKPMNEFRDWDEDDDGYITPAEAMKRETLFAKKSKAEGEIGGSITAAMSAEGGSKFGKKGGGGPPSGFSRGGGERPSFDRGSGGPPDGSGYPFMKKKKSGN